MELPLDQPGSAMKSYMPSRQTVGVKHDTKDAWFVCEYSLNPCTNCVLKILSIKDMMASYV